MSDNVLPTVNDTANKIAEETDSDVLFYSGPIRFLTARQFIRATEFRKRRENVLLMLVTGGGHPDAAYRISRYLQQNYKGFTCFIPGWCKSAGTLIALGAQTLVMSDHAELGPLDTQISKRDEMFESQSGLVVSTSLQALREETFKAFEHFLSEFKSGYGTNATLRTATDVAAKLATGLFGHVYSQIDPSNIAETRRSIVVAREYGMRLQAKSGNYTLESLDNLINGYPSHEFVIDRTEARQLFKSVRESSDQEYILALLLGDSAFIPSRDNIVEPRFLSDEINRQPSGNQNEATTDEQQPNSTDTQDGRAAKKSGLESRNPKIG